MFGLELGAMISREHEFVRLRKRVVELESQLADAQLKLAKQARYASVTLSLADKTEQVPVYWLRRPFEPRDVDFGRYTLDPAIAMQWNARTKGNTSSLIRGWKTPGGFVLLSDPAKLTIPVARMIDSFDEK